MISEFLKDYGAPIAWFVASLGWYISNRQANAREKRKEFRAEIDAIEKVVKELVSKLATYCRSTERNGAARMLELEIKVLFYELGLKWERISKRRGGRGDACGKYFGVCSSKHEEFFEQSTSIYFETEERIPSDKMNTHILDIHMRALLFTESLHNLFLRKFDGI